MATARQRANDKFNKKAYKRFEARLKPEQYNALEELREKLNLSKPELLMMFFEEYKKSRKG